MHLHILGIGGSFMGGLALLAQAAGHRVSGCDRQIYPPMSDQLAAAGIDVFEGDDAEQINLKPDLFVVGNAVTRGHRLMEAILSRGLPFVSGPQWIGEQVLRGPQRPRVVAVAGTHGKTTTASMVAWILEAAGVAPGFLIGGVPNNFNVSARLPDARVQSPVFVIEADEYDSAFFDKRSKFVHYFPKVAVLNNLEFDHADIFPDLAAIETQFHHLVRCVAADGRLIVPAAQAAIERVLARGCWTPVERFSDEKSWHARSIDEGQSHCFDVYLGAQRWGRLTLPLAGAFNRSNAIAAIAAAAAVGVDPGQAIDAMSRFSGVKRRLELRGQVGGITVYDDFVHHPTAIAATLRGLRLRLGSAARIVAVLEPRSNTMKLGAMNAQLPQSLSDADAVFCYAATSGKHALGWDPAQVLTPLGARAATFDRTDALLRALTTQLRANDHVVVMSNGGFDGLPLKLLDALRQSAGAQIV